MTHPFLHTVCARTYAFKTKTFSEHLLRKTSPITSPVGERACVDCFLCARHWAESFLDICTLNLHIKGRVGSTFLIVQMRKQRHREVNHLPEDTQQWQILEEQPGLSKTLCHTSQREVPACPRHGRRAEEAEAHMGRGNWRCRPRSQRGRQF